MLLIIFGFTECFCQKVENTFFSFHTSVLAASTHRQGSGPDVTQRLQVLGYLDMLATLSHSQPFTRYSQSNTGKLVSDTLKFETAATLITVKICF